MPFRNSNRICHSSENICLSGSNFPQSIIFRNSPPTLEKGWGHIFQNSEQFSLRSNWNIYQNFPMDLVAIAVRLQIAALKSHWCGRPPCKQAWWPAWQPLLPLHVNIHPNRARRAWVSVLSSGVPRGGLRWKCIHEPVALRSWSAWQPQTSHVCRHLQVADLQELCIISTCCCAIFNLFAPSSVLHVPINSTMCFIIGRENGLILKSEVDVSVTTPLHQWCVKENGLQSLISDAFKWCLDLVNVIIFTFLLLIINNKIILRHNCRDCGRSAAIWSFSKNHQFPSQKNPLSSFGTPWI